MALRQSKHGGGNMEPTDDYYVERKIKNCEMLTVIQYPAMGRSLAKGFLSPFLFLLSYLFACLLSAIQYHTNYAQTANSRADMSSQ